MHLTDYKNIRSNAATCNDSSMFTALLNHFFFSNTISFGKLSHCFAVVWNQIGFVPDIRLLPILTMMINNPTFLFQRVTRLDYRQDHLDSIDVCCYLYAVAFLGSVGCTVHPMDSQSYQPSFISEICSPLTSTTALLWTFLKSSWNVTYSVKPLPFDFLCVKVL